MKYFKKTDIIIIAVILVAAVSIFFMTRGFGKSGAFCEVYSYDKLIDTIDLSASNGQSFTYKEAEGLGLAVTNGEIFFEYSDCPDKVCIRAGKLSKTGETAACLPNGILIKIVGERTEDDIDTLVK